MALPLVHVAIENVTDPTYVKSLVIKPELNVDPTKPESLQLQEVYAGFITLQADNHAAPTARSTYRSFLPIEPLKIRFYGQPTLKDPEIQVAVCVSPAGFSDDDDEANVVSVDSASVELKSQTLPGVSGSPLCLLLSVDQAILNGRFHRIAYNVTVLSDFLSRIVDADLPERTKPE